MRTKTAVVYEHNKPVVVDNLELDEPKAKEVLVRMNASGVCHSDLSVVNGAIHYNPPVALGHEGAGVIEQIGEDVNYVQVGDHILLSFVTYCNQCRMCTMTKVSLCEGFSARVGYLLDDTCRLHTSLKQPVPQMARIGTMSEYTVVPEQSLIKIDTAYSLEKAVLVGCGVTTGIGAVLNTAKVKPGSSVAIVGSGGVGLNVIQQKLDLAKDFGATDLINASKANPVDQIQDLTDGKGVDYAFEVVGNPKTIEQAYEMIRPAGTVVVVGVSHHEAKINIPAQQLVRQEKRIIGSFYGSSIPRIDMPKILELYNQGKIRLDELITKNYRLDQINQAFEDMEAGKNARGVILFGE